MAEMECPRCQRLAECEVEFKLGRLDLRTYRLGEALEWAGGNGRKPLRRPDGGNARTEGYADCPQCGRDFWVTIHVQDDRLAVVVPDPARPGYI
ncbi:hypothetical protein [Catenuloplanes japonicus]|uniref:hypothetical protein n=1 Tax=Catenuloplanes japonicus TaxID=33876 RepID=UPI0012F82439|nr:hypothetical protein [Catenuloplanes japonicus]